MEDMQDFYPKFMAFLPILVGLFIWSTVWKLIGLWKAGRNNEPGWFICIALINTLGILPIIYLLIQRNRKPATQF